MSAPSPISRSAGALAALAMLAAVVSLAAGTPSGAAFTDSDANPSNSFAANSSFTRGMMSGAYTGNGTDLRQITGLGFRPDIVIVKSEAAQGAVIRTRTMTGDQTKPVNGATAIANNRIEALTADGFQVGTDATVNTNGTVYQWFAATTRSGSIAAGSYLGDATATRDVATPGMSPEAVMLLPASATVAPISIEGMTQTMRLDTGTTVANSIVSRDSEGFTVGNSTSSNSNNIAYHWIAFSDTAGLVSTETYAGNNTSGRSITGTGFSPAFVLTRATITSSSRNAVFRTPAMTSANSSYFSATATLTTGITALGSDGFTVGNSTHTNGSSTTYAYLALDEN